MGQYRYITKRTLQNKAGEDRGTILVTVKKDSDRAEGKYTCPECGAQGAVNQEFKRPFSVKCQNCGFRMRLPKMKGKA